MSEQAFLQKGTPFSLLLYLYLQIALAAPKASSKSREMGSEVGWHMGEYGQATRSLLAEY